jgi:regulator of chromosome condensation
VTITYENHDTNLTSNSMAPFSNKRKTTASKVNRIKKDEKVYSRLNGVDFKVTDTTQEVESSHPTKKVKTTQVPIPSYVSGKQAVSRNANPRKLAKPVNKVPTVSLDIFVFGDGSCAQLGLGSKTVGNMSPTEALVPRLNPQLSSEKVGVVQFACGGMHTVALTRDNTILTWGVNDLGALGRDTKVEEDEDDDDELNPSESIPGLVNTAHLGPDIIWSQVVASDNATFALTNEGRVYGWGTFRVCFILCPTIRIDVANNVVSQARVQWGLAVLPLSKKQQP